jgi:hypothetical protein
MFHVYFGWRTEYLLRYVTGVLAQWLNSGNFQNSRRLDIKSQVRIKIHSTFGELRFLQVCRKYSFP